MAKEIKNKMLKRCNCDFRSSNHREAEPIKMFFKTDEIFDDDKYKKLISKPANDNDLRVIIANERLKNYPNKGKLPVSEKEANIDSDWSGEDKFPPVEVEPICVDKLTINVKLSKANPSD